MKQMRSRFRFLTLLLVCGFLLALVLCAGNLLKTAGISLPRLPSAAVSPSPLPAGESAEPAPPAPEGTLSPSSPLTEDPAMETVSPGTDNLTQTEYNLFGL